MANETFKCDTKRCRGRVRSEGRQRFCNVCRNARWREKNPIKYFFGKLRNNAKRRKKEFSLTLEQFAHFWHTTGYAERRGKTAQSLSINRIDNQRGYHFDNIEAIPLSVNARYQYANIPAYVRAEMEAELNKPNS